MTEPITVIDRKNELPPIFTTWAEYYTFLMRANVPAENEKVVRYQHSVSATIIDEYINSMEHIRAMCFIELMSVMPSNDELHQLMQILWAAGNKQSMMLQKWQISMNQFVNLLISIKNER